MSRIHRDKRVHELLIQLHKNIEEDGYFYLSAQTFIDELNDLYQVQPAALPVITVEDMIY